MNALANLSNEELLAQIAQMKRQMKESLAVRGPRIGPKFVEQRLLPRFAELEAERARRRKQ